MGIAYVALVVLYIFICFFLILVVLVQQGKGADIAGAFGGGGTQTAFGARGATTLLHKLTTASFIGFILLSLALTVLQARERPSVVKGVPQTINTKGVFPKPAGTAPAGQQPATGQPSTQQPSTQQPSTQQPAAAPQQPAAQPPAAAAPAPASKAPAQNPPPKK